MYIFFLHFFFLFGLQVNPSSADGDSKQIQNRLGDYNRVLIVQEGVKKGWPHKLQPLSEFKKPHQSNGRPIHHQHRSMVKTGEAKPSYDGRAGFPPCLPIKHGTSSANGHRPNGAVSQTQPAPISPSTDTNLAASVSGRNLSHVPPYQVSKHDFRIFFFYIFVCIF